MSVLKICSKKIISLQYCFWGKDHTQNIVLANPAGIITKEAAIKDHESQPIDRYLHKLREDGSLADGDERYYSRNLDKTILAMSGWGFDVHRLQRQTRV